MTARGGGAVDAIGEFYDRVTDPYVRAWNSNLHMGYWEPGAQSPTVEEATEALTSRALDELRTAPGDRVLDVGCGIGKPALRLARSRAVEVVGISISEAQIETATASAAAGGLEGRVTFRVADAAALPCPDDAFDAVLCLEMLHHVQDRAGALREIARVLRPGGSVVVVDFALRGAVPEADRPLVDAFAQACNLVTLTTIDRYERDVAAAGLTLRATHDVSDRVVPSMHQHADAIRAARAELGAVVGADRLAHMVDLTERYAALPQFGYVILAAERAGAPG